MCFDSEKPHIITEMTTTVGILKIIRKSCNKSIELIIRVIYLIVNVTNFQQKYNIHNISYRTLVIAKVQLC
jgi:hypothetical protein